MGDPGTKEVFSLSDLEATGQRMMGRKHVLSILVENEPGVLARISGLFARRGYNINTLAVGPTDAAVVEDALAGVEAGRRGGFGLVVGVDRNGHAEQLAAQGADVVIRDLAELHIDPDGSWSVNSHQQIGG